jgi:hypothetical protein
MPRLRPITLFLCRFAILYIILVVPWPGWDRIYGICFRSLGSTIFASNSGPRELSFTTPSENMPRPFLTRIVIVNRKMMREDGAGPVRNLDMDAQSFGWKPTALLLALIATTPIPWRRRGLAILWGLLCLHILIIAGLGFCIWNQSTEVSLVTLTPFLKHVADTFQGFLVSQYGLMLPALVWLSVTFRREDFLETLGRALDGSGTDAKPRV